MPERGDELYKTVPRSVHRSVDPELLQLRKRDALYFGATERAEPVRAEHLLQQGGECKRQLDSEPTVPQQVVDQTSGHG